MILLLALLFAQAQPNPDAERLSAAQQLMDQGRCPEAIPILKALIARYPAAPTLKYGLGRCYFETEDFVDAVATLRQAASQIPQSPEVHFFLGSALGRAGNAADAVQELRIAIELDPKFEPAYRALGIFRLQSGSRSEDVREALETALRLNPNDARAHYWLGRYHQAGGDNEPARECFERARKLDPGDLLTRLGLGQTMLADGDLDPALEQFDFVLRQHPGLVPALLGRARALYEKGEAKEALAPAEAAEKGALALDDRSAGEWLLSHIYRDLGRDSDAEAAERRLTRIHESLGADAARLRELNDTAARYRAEGRPDKVAEAMEEFVKIRETPDAQILLGDAYLALGRRADAERCYVRASQIGPLTDALKQKLERARSKQ